SVKLDQVKKESFKVSLTTFLPDLEEHQLEFIVNSTTKYHSSTPEKNSSLAEVVSFVYKIFKVEQENWIKINHQKLSSKSSTMSWKSYEKYDGKVGKPIRKWLKILEEYMNVDEIVRDAAKVSIVKIKCSEDVNDFIESLPPADIATYELLKNKLIERYDRKLPYVTAQTRLKCFRMDLREENFYKSVIEFCELVAQSCDETGSSLLNNQISRLMSKLEHNDHLWTRLLNNKEYKNVTEMASDLEATLKLTNARYRNLNKKNFKTQDKVKLDDKKKKKDLSNITCLLCNEKGHYANHCPKKKSNIKDSSNVNVPRILFRSCRVEAEPLMIKGAVQTSNDMFVATVINENVRVFAIIDSAGQRTIMDVSLCNELGIVPVKSKVGNLTGFSGEIVTEYGLINASLRFENGVVFEGEFFVTDILKATNSAHIILGNDLLKILKSNVDFGNFSLSFCERAVPVYTLNDIAKGRVILRITNQENVEPEFFDQLKSDFEHCFSKDKYDLGLCDIPCPKLEVVDSQPVKVKSYPIPMNKKDCLERTITGWLKANIIVEDPNQQYLLNLVFVGKKGGEEDRICLDTRPLNKVLKDDRYKVPSIKEILGNLSGCNFFSTLDISNAFFKLNWMNIPLLLLVFVDYERIMNQILSDQPQAISFVDDIIIFSKGTIDQHKNDIFETLKCIGSHNLKLNFSKCNFFGTSVTYLGYTISKFGHKPNQTSVQAILRFPEPKNADSIKRWHGKINYFRNYLPNLAMIEQPILKLLKKSQPFSWGSVEKECFNKINQMLANSTYLMYPDLNRKFILHTDASQAAFGAALLQEPSPNVNDTDNVKENDHDKVNVKCMSSQSKNLVPVAFFSRTNPHRQKFIPSVYLELAAISQSLVFFREWLYGSVVEIHTDHKPLLSLISNNTDRYFFRHIETILEFNAKIVYLPGHSNVIADSLSRSCCRINVSECFNIFEIAVNQNLDETCKDSFELSPDKLELMKEVHINTNHASFSRSFNVLKQRKSWSGMSVDFKKFIDSCETCKKNNFLHARNTLLKTTTAYFPFQRMNIDLNDGLKPSKNSNKFILGLVCVLSKYSILIPIHDSSAQSVIDAFLKNVIYVYGRPQFLKADNGKSFNNDMFKDFCTRAGITLEFSTAYHHSGNSNIERLFRSVNRGIAKKLSEEIDKSFVQLDWEDVLPHVNFALNITKHSTTNQTPFFMVFNRYPILVSDKFESERQMLNVVDFELDEVVRQKARSLANKICKDVLEEVRNASNEKVNDKNKIMNPPSIGDKIYVKNF
uniref:RNA-directed DNA polymerase n=1 Tax=Strongyloides papillosus TaxID=174720 RepID=A0A0N5B9S5_STREA